jgi:plastocyanin
VQTLRDDTATISVYPNRTRRQKHAAHEPDTASSGVSTETALRRIPMWLLVVIVPAAAVIAVVITNFVASDQQGATAGSAAAPDTVVIKNFSFSPKPLTVTTGSTITVINDDSTAHTFTANNGAFDTGDVGGGQRGRVTVDRAGTFAYHCEIHPFMTGTARVSP